MGHRKLVITDAPLWWVHHFGVNNGRGYTCVKARIYGKPLYLPLNFAVNLKLLFKKSKKNHGSTFEWYLAIANR